MKEISLLEILATEGGKRKRGVGLSTSSKRLWEDLERLFLDIQIPILKDKWIYKKYAKKYYGIVFKKRLLKKIEENCRDLEIKTILKYRDF